MAKLFRDDWWLASGPLRYGPRALQFLPYTPDAERDADHAIFSSCGLIPPSHGSTQATFTSIGDLLGRSLQSRRLAAFAELGTSILTQSGYE